MTECGFKPCPGCGQLKIPNTRDLCQICELDKQLDQADPLNQEIADISGSKNEADVIEFADHIINLMAESSEKKAQALKTAQAEVKSLLILLDEVAKAIGIESYTDFSEIIERIWSLRSSQKVAQK
ncbi:MAG: hypothetical protein KKB70_08340 [Proteobacteria bacterium]|nr:hypothetical protein [Pseudomonadota bacterium]